MLLYIVSLNEWTSYLLLLQAIAVLSVLIQFDSILFNLLDHCSTND